MVFTSLHHFLIGNGDEHVYIYQWESCSDVKHAWYNPARLATLPPGRLATLPPVRLATLPYGLDSNVTQLLANLLTKPSVFYYLSIVSCNLVSIKLLLLLLLLNNRLNSIMLCWWYSNPSGNKKRRHQHATTWSTFIIICMYYQMRYVNFADDTTVFASNEQLVTLTMFMPQGTGRSW